MLFLKFHNVITLTWPNNDLEVCHHGLHSEIVNKIHHYKKPQQSASQLRHNDVSIISMVYNKECSIPRVQLGSCMLCPSRLQLFVYHLGMIAQTILG